MNRMKSYMSNSYGRMTKKKKNTKSKFEASKTDTFMKLTFLKLATFIFIFLISNSQSKSQVLSAKQVALVSSVIENVDNQDANYGIFKTMESIRFGMSPGLKGVQLRLEQPTCFGQLGAISLANTSGEAWKYRVLGKSGTVLGEGDVGYDRRLQGIKQGEYLIHFTMADGTSAIDEFEILPGKELKAQIESITNSGSVGTAQEFIGSCAGATEFTWDFGDGATAFGETKVNHTFTKEGSFTVTLKASYLECHAIVKQSVNITYPLAQEKD